MGLVPRDMQEQNTNYVPIEWQAFCELSRCCGLGEAREDIRLEGPAFLALASTDIDAHWNRAAG